MSTETKMNTRKRKASTKKGADKKSKKARKEEKYDYSKDICGTCHRFIPTAHHPCHSSTAKLRKEPDSSDFAEDPAGAQGCSCGDGCKLVYCSGKPWCRSDPIPTCIASSHSGFCGNCSAALYCHWNICDECSHRLGNDGECNNKACENCQA